MPSVRNLVIAYDALNDNGTFSEGDTITGKVTLELEKETKIESLFVKAKGDVSVHWSERHGDKTRNYDAHRRLFKQKHFLISQEANDVRLPAGIHIFNFSLQIPLGNMPSSFRGNYGKAVYKLEVKLSRSWRMDSTDEKELCFVSKSFPGFNQMNFPQTGSTNKNVGVFSKGTVQMDVTVDKRGYVPGDTVFINAKINNSSSKDVIPKFSLIQDVVYRASGNTKFEKNIPSNTPMSILDCDILSVEYRIKGYLDISFSSDPSVVFPVVICSVSPHSAALCIRLSIFLLNLIFCSSPATHISSDPPTIPRPSKPSVPFSSTNLQFTGTSSTKLSLFHNPI
uniref:Arrestin C-terminal-like domain-containing protein n=1 Tax=Knipowitschia caucasica TaxID=637954 RepID=A0AAV2MRD4_KNICA